MLLNEQTFATGVLPNGFHIVASSLASVADIVNGTWADGSIPVSEDCPWYADAIGDTVECDEFTAWLNTAYVRANVSPLSTDNDDAHKVLSFLAQDVVRYLGVTESTGILLITCHAIVVGGAAYIKEFGHVPLDANDFVDNWEIE